MESFVTAHPIKSLTTQFYRKQMERLKAIVPDINMALCVAGGREKNRTHNRAIDIIPCK